MAEGIQVNHSQESINDVSGNPDSTSQPSHLLQRAKSDRIALTKAEEDRRRRTIIVEKKNGTYGFTLQSYGIHYKKEHEVEMITYVDYVEYDGPAYKSGMREGDVILSINGNDMEKSDHKTLVAFVKNCDTRMRMVVLFEDCVRKVELHMRYIQLQNVLQSKMNELERTCLKERELLEGKWKTHSLPAPRKKPSATNASPSEENVMSPTIDSVGQTSGFPNTRPISTEDVNLARIHKHHPHVIPPPAQFMLTYQFLDPHCRYILKPSTSSSSGEYLLSIGPPSRSKSEHQQFYVSSERDDKLGSSHENFPNNYHRHEYSEKLSEPARSGAAQKTSKSRHCHGGHSCNPCIGHKKDKQNNGDNVSLDAYDLASPCCNPQCVPSRRRSKNKEHKHKHRDKESKDRSQRPRSQSHANPSAHYQKPIPVASHHYHQNEKHQQNHRRLYELSNQLASRCSLHSCISSSEFDGCGMAENSTTSYTTSLSTDTLYGDLHSDASTTNSRQQSTKSRQSFTNQQATVGLLASKSQQLQYASQQQQQHHHHHHHQHRYHVHTSATTATTKHADVTSYGTQANIQYIQQKPKSWDNLAMKAFGGYGFGYGYLEKTGGPKSQANLASTGSMTTGGRFVGSGTSVKQQHHGLSNNSSSIETLPTNHQRHSIPRKNAFGRYSTLDIENYAPPPSQFVQEFAANTTTTTSITKSTDNLLGAYNISDSSIHSTCDCNIIDIQKKILKQHSQPNDCIGYYSHLPKTTIITTTNNNGTSNIKTTNGNGGGGSNSVATISEITRL